MFATGLRRLASIVSTIVVLLAVSPPLSAKVGQSAAVSPAPANGGATVDGLQLSLQMAQVAHLGDKIPVTVALTNVTSDQIFANYSVLAQSLKFMVVDGKGTHLLKRRTILDATASSYAPRPYFPPNFPRQWNLNLQDWVDFDHPGIYTISASLTGVRIWGNNWMDATLRNLQTSAVRLQVLP